jgi:hypothetical protein
MDFFGSYPYRHKKQALGYGLKFWPGETAAMLAQEASLKWVGEHYQ